MWKGSADEKDLRGQLVQPILLPFYLEGDREGEWLPENTQQVAAELGQHRGLRTPCVVVVFLPPHCLGGERQGPSLRISSQDAMHSAVRSFIQQVLVGIPWPSSG